MTRLQRLAVRAVYFKNFERKTKGEIADSLGISLDTLKDRMTLAFAKIADEFRDLYPKYDAKKELGKRKKWRPKRTPVIPQPIRVTRSGGTSEVFTPTAENPRPFGPLKAREGIDVEKIKRQIRAEFFD